MVAEAIVHFCHEQMMQFVPHLLKLTLKEKGDAVSNTLMVSMTNLNQVFFFFYVGKS